MCWNFQYSIWCGIWAFLGKDNIISYHFFSQILNISLKFSWRWNDVNIFCDSHILPKVFTVSFLFRFFFSKATSILFISEKKLHLERLSFTFGIVICIQKSATENMNSKAITPSSVIGWCFYNPYSCVAVECASNQKSRRRVRTLLCGESLTKGVLEIRMVWS